MGKRIRKMVVFVDGKIVNNLKIEFEVIVPIPIEITGIEKEVKKAE